MRTLTAKTKALGTVVIGSISAVVVLLFMAATGTGFAIVNDGNRGVKKTGTEYEMTEVQPGYHFFIPVYQTIAVDTIRPKLINYSVSEAAKEDSELLIFEPVLKGLDKKGIPIKLALSIEVRPVADQLAEMYKSDGDFENAFYKKVLQVNRDAVQTTISKFSVDTIMDKRGEVEKTLNDILVSSYAKNPYFMLENINLKDIIVPKRISDKQLEVQAAKQDALISAELIEKAKNQAASAKEKAQGEANAARIKAQGKADAIYMVAESKARSNKVVSASITEEVLRADTIQAWREGGALVPTYVGSENSQFIMNLKD